MVENKISRIDITARQHALIWDQLISRGAEMAIGEHEGNTLSKDGFYLCQSDGQYWVLLEGDVVLTDQAPGADRVSDCEHCGISGQVRRLVIIPEGRAKGDLVCTGCAVEYNLDA